MRETSFCRRTPALPRSTSCGLSNKLRDATGKAKPMTNAIGELNPPTRLMMTPGPCSIDPRVYRALSMPIVGHLDPWFRGCMEETQVLMRRLFQTENRITFPLSASGSGGIEASVFNSLEPGDEAICCVNGLFSERMYVIAQHTPAN